MYVFFSTTKFENPTKMPINQRKNREKQPKQQSFFEIGKQIISTKKGWKKGYNGYLRFKKKDLGVKRDAISSNQTFED